MVPMGKKKLSSTRRSGPWKRERKKKKPLPTAEKKRAPVFLDKEKCGNRTNPVGEKGKKTNHFLLKHKRVNKKAPPHRRNKGHVLKRGKSVV